MQQTTLILVLVGFCITITSSQLSGYVAPSEIMNMKSAALSTLSNPPSLGEAFFATKVLETTKVSGSIVCNCATMGSLFKTARSSLDVYYGVAAGKTCGCGLEASADAKLAVFEDLKVRFLFLIS